MRTPRSLAHAWLVTLLLLVPAAAGLPAPAHAAERARLVIGVIPGVQLFPLMVIDKFGLAARHGIELERKELQNPQAVYVQLSQKGVDLGFVGWTGSFVLRAKGYDVVNVYSFALNNNVVLVKADSPIKTIADLRGRRVGLYGGPVGLSTATLKIIAKKHYGLDLEKDCQINYGAPGAQAGLLEKGALDAMLSLDPIATKLLSAGGYRSIARIDEEWNKFRGHPALLVTMMTRGDVLRERSAALEGFIRAFRDARKILLENDAVWTELAASIGIKDAKTVDVLRTSLRGVYSDTWNAAVVGEIKAIATEGYDLLGKDFLPVPWDEKSFDLRFGGLK